MGARGRSVSIGSLSLTCVAVSPCAACAAMCCLSSSSALRASSSSFRSRSMRFSSTARRASSHMPLFPPCCPLGPPIKPPCTPTLPSLLCRCSCRLLLWLLLLSNQPPAPRSGDGMPQVALAPEVEVELEPGGPAEEPGGVIRSCHPGLDHPPCCCWERSCCEAWTWWREGWRRPIKAAMPPCCGTNHKGSSGGHMVYVYGWPS